MRKLLTTLATIVIAVVISTPVLGGPSGKGHSHDPINAAAASVRAQSVVTTMVRRKIVDKSWASIAPSGAEKTKRGRRTEWKVTFNNPAIANKAKDTLYVFLTMSGGYLAANYTGR